MPSCPPSCVLQSRNDHPRDAPAGIDDAALAADLMTAAYPEEPSDPVVTRHRWESTSKSWSVARHIAELDGDPVAFVSWVHPPWEPDSQRECEVDVSLNRARMEADLFAWLCDWVDVQAAAGGARTLSTYCAEDDPISRAVLERLGYEHDRTDRVWELDLSKHRERLLADAAAALDRARDEGIHLGTLAAWDDPDRLRKVHALSELTRQDIPHTLPIWHQAFEDYVERIASPDLPHDRFWVALDRDRLAAMSYMRFPPVRGNVWTGYTCSDRDYRGRGLGMAIKLQSIAQAIGLGVLSIRTANDSENAPMLRINEKLGYTRRPGFVGYLKRVNT